MEIEKNEWLLCNRSSFNNSNTEDWWNNLFDTIKFTNKKYIYLDNLHEHHVYQNEEIKLPLLDDLLEEQNKKLFISLSGEKRNEHVKKLFVNLRNIKIWIIPVFHLHFLMSLDKQIKNKQQKIENYSKFHTLFICLNNHYKKNKYELVKKIAKTDLPTYGTITYLDNKTNEWPNITQVLDGGPISDGVLNLSLYKRPLIDLVSESEYEHIRITEKTWKPILLGQIFLVNGAPFFYKYLKELGFKCYDEIFDYSFDSETNMDKRIDIIIDNIQRLKKKNYNSIYKSVYEKIQYNKQLANKFFTEKLEIPKDFIEFDKNLYKMFWEEEDKENEIIKNEIFSFHHMHTVYIQPTII